MIFSHARQVNFSRTVWITFHCRGITSSVSVIVLAELGQLAAAARAGGRRRRSPRARAADAPASGARTGLLRVKRDARVVPLGRRSGGLVLGGARFQLLELQLHLVEQLAAALGGCAVQLALQLGDQQLADGRSSPRRRRREPRPAAAPRARQPAPPAARRCRRAAFGRRHVPD